MSGIWSLEEAKEQHSTSELLSTLLPQYLPNEPVVDYGCGNGFYIKRLRKKGFVAIGIEGTEDINKVGEVQDIIVADLSKELIVPLPASTSLCLEVAEHIEAKYQAIFLKNITKNCNGRLILSWAIPHQGGHGHVNEKENLSVIHEIKKHGFTLCFDETIELRQKLKGDRCWWFVNTIFIFDKI